MALLIAEEYPVLPPRVFVAEELKLATVEWVEGVDDPEKSFRIARTMCS